MMEFHEIWEKSLRKQRFERLAAAHRAAIWHGLFRSARLFRQALEGMGCWQDIDENWHEDTRPIKPIADLPDGTWADNHDEF